MKRVFLTMATILLLLVGSCTPAFAFIRPTDPPTQSGSSQPQEPSSSQPDEPPVSSAPSTRPDILFMSTNIACTVVNIRLSNFDGSEVVVLQVSLDGVNDWVNWSDPVTVDPPYLRMPNTATQALVVYLRLVYSDGFFSSPTKTTLRPLPLTSNPSSDPDAPPPLPEEDPSGGDFDGGDRKPQPAPSKPPLTSHSPNSSTSSFAQQSSSFAEQSSQPLKVDSGESGTPTIQNKPVKRPQFPIAPLLALVAIFVSVLFVGRYFWGRKR